MDKTNIQALLRKFYAGETSDAEEAQLMDFFATSPDANDFPTDRACFASLLGAKAENAPRDLEANLDAMLSGLAKAESKTGFRLWRSPLRSLAAAAAVLLFTVVGLEFRAALVPKQSTLPLIVTCAGAAAVVLLIAVLIVHKKKKRKKTAVK